MASPPQQHTLALIKPDAVGHPWLFMSTKQVQDEDGNMQREQVVQTISPDKSANIKQRILDDGFTIVQERRLVLSLSKAKEFYSEHNGKPFFDELCTYMCSGPIIALVLSKPGAITDWRRLMGPTDPAAAREIEEEKIDPSSDDMEDGDDSQWRVMESWPIRAAFGVDNTKNSVHGSDSEYAAEREIEFFFPAEDQWQRSACVILPHVAERSDSVVADLENQGLFVCASKQVTLSVTEASELVSKHKEDEERFSTLVQALTAGPLVALVVEGTKAVLKLRIVLGPSDSRSVGLGAVYATDATNADQPAFLAPESVNESTSFLAQLFPEPLPLTRTVALLKPDVTSKRAANEIIRQIKYSGFEVITKSVLRFSKQDAAVFYAPLKDNSPTYDQLCAHLATGPVIALVLGKPRAVECWAVACGPEHPDEAAKHNPNSIRAIFGTSAIHNAVHASKTAQDVDREIALLFPKISNNSSRTVESLFSTELDQQQTLQQVLIEGLTEICKRKPSELDAVRQLGEWLLENNPKRRGGGDGLASDPSAAAMSTPSLTSMESKEFEPANGKPLDETLPNKGEAVPLPPALANKRVIFLLGAPGCGKRTQCKLIVNEYGFVHISPADLLRAEVESGSKMGEEIKLAMEAGDVVPPITIINLIKKAMRRNGSSKYLIDDFPRDLDQAVLFEQQVAHCESIVQFTCPDEIARNRSLSGGLTEEVFNRRMDMFKERSTPVIDFYQRLGKVKVVDGSPESVQRVFQAVRKCVEPKVIFVFGGPGAGKSSLCKKIEHEFGYVHLCASEILREHARKGTEEGQRFKRMIAKGQLVPTNEMMALVRAVMDDHPSNKFIMDGFPRSLKQFSAFESQVTKAEFGIFLNTSVDTMKKRVPNATGFKQRYKVFAEEEQPVIHALRSMGRLREFDSTGDEKQVWKNVKTTFHANIVIALGPPGSGVEKYSAAISETYGYTLLTEKALLEAEVRRRSREGILIDNMNHNGQIVPVDLKLMMLKKVIEESGNDKFIVQGFPRAVDQYIAWNKYLSPPSMVLHFDCPEPECIERAVEEGTSDFERKLNVFNTQTLPIVNKYARSGVLKTIDTTQTPSWVDYMLRKFFAPEFVVVVGQGNLDDAENQRVLTAFADKQGYQLIDVPEMVKQATENCGAFEGDLARANQRDAVDALIRTAVVASGKRGLLLTHHPKNSAHVRAMEQSLGQPLRVFHLHCPASVVKEHALARGEEEDAADEIAEKYAHKVTTSEDPIVLAYENAKVPVTKIQTSGNKELVQQLLAPFKPELVLLAGRSGTGRGELATRLTRHHGFVYLHMTSLLMDEVERGTGLGRVIEDAMEKKRNVPLEAAIAVIKNAVVNHGVYRYLLDGYPRLVGDGYPFAHDQYFALEKHVGPVKAVINLTATNETRRGRLSKTANPDDAIAAADETFRLEKDPVLAFSKAMGVFIDIDANPEADIVADAVVDAMEERETRIAKELRDLTMTADDIMREKVDKVIAQYGADESHVEEVEKYFSQFDMNEDGKLTFGEMMAKMQAWGLEKDPHEYMGMDFQDESVVTKDEWYKFILKSVFLLDPNPKKADEEDGEAADEEE